MSKYDILISVAEKVKALDNDVKLKILALLVEEGSKSITDISKELGINFSTTHKYLEQFEAVGLVSSKQVSENRLKRQFTIKDFSIDISPKGLSELISGKAAQEMKGGLKVLNETGPLVDFDERLFSQKYLKRGMPRGTMASAIKNISEQAYDGITLLELRRMFKKELEKKTENIHEVFKQIEIADRHKRTFAHLLELVHPEALDMHANGDIFIKNLREPKLLNFVHDIRGLIIHGVSGIQAKNIKDILHQMIAAVDFVSDLSPPAQTFDTFNYFLAPLVKNMSDLDLQNILREFFEALRKINSEFYICIDLSAPKYIEDLPIGFWAEKNKDTYLGYDDVAQKISKVVLDLANKNNYNNIRIVLKFQNDELERITKLNLPNKTHILNMSADWQRPNASYAGDARFDSEWKGWLGTIRVGEIQNIVINLPRLAKASATSKDLGMRIEKLILQCCDYLENMAELSLGEFLRKHNTRLKSIHKERWTYINVDDCMHAISITGLKNSLEVAKEKINPEKILKICEQALAKRPKIPLRILLKENADEAIAKRFHTLDSRTNKNLAPYAPGAALDINNFHLQKYLRGGHCAQISKNQISLLKKYNFGAVLLTK